MFNNEEAEFQAKSEPLAMYQKNDADRREHAVEER